MSPLTSFAILQLLVTFTGQADSKAQDYVSSGDGKLPSKCERYSGRVCSKFVANQLIFVRPLQEQAQKEMQMSMLFRYLPDYISTQCQPYALQALCLSAFPPCDLNESFPKPRLFCQDECRILEEYICVNEFNIGRAKYMTTFIRPCSQLPSVNSPEHKRCVRLNLTIDKPEFKLELKNKTVKVDDTVVLKCKLKPTEIPPTITWYKDGVVIPPGHAFYKIHLFRHSSRLKIRHIKARDSGKYTCHVSNFITNVSTHSWLTVLPQVVENKTKLSKRKNHSSCGYLGPSAICGPYLQTKKVFFHDFKKQHELELLIHNSLTHSNVSAHCYKKTTAALCYHMFPSCGKNDVMKHRLCKEDCQKVKKKGCRNKVPDIFPTCSRLPRVKGRRGRHCEKLEDKRGIIESSHSMCGKYNGNNFCGKYLENETIYFENMPYKYQLEKTISWSLKEIAISEKCSQFGIPAMCYHLFPVCSQGKRRSRLCQGECTKLKTEICRSEVLLLKKVSEIHLKALFPECANLPRAETDEGKHCVELGMPTKKPDTTTDTAQRVSTENLTIYDPSHNCYNDSGSNYLGTANVTVFGNFCVSWSLHRPSTGWKHNFCRNPWGDTTGDAKSPWCYVEKGRREYCEVEKCDVLSKALHQSGGESTSLGRTIYVVIAIVAVILLGCITVIVYWKVQNSKENVDNSAQNSAAPFAKCSSIQLTDKENTSVQSLVLNEKLTRGRVKYVSVISEGKICRVFKGVLVNEQGKPNMDIVIKTLSEDASSLEQEVFRRETSLLCPLQHMNILGLLGISPGEGAEFVVFEYLSEINLHQFLKQASPQNGGTNPSMDILLNIASQIANGMKYLSEFSYVHGDLAARNCFIADEGQLTVKISLLGIGSHKYPSHYDYLNQENTLFPIRWMSPEALDSFVMTSENDVWAFGVLLWEIFTHGVKPYQQYNNAEVMDKIRALELLPCPIYWPQTVRTLMNNCWTVAPSSRPNFVTIYDTLNSQRFDHVTDDIIEEVQV